MYRIITALLLSFVTLYLGAAQVAKVGMILTVHNVGQGNGIVIQVPGKETFICDAGSSAAPTDLKSGLKITTEQIAAQIKENVSKNGGAVSCTISHADKDHGNLIPKIIDPLMALPHQQRPALVSLLGGSKKDYKNNRDLKFALATLEKGVSCKDVASCKKPEDLQTQLPDYVTVLAGDSQNVDKNDQSLVLKAENEGFSVILPGDATGKIVDGLSEDVLDASILVASHHGAQLHDTNSVEFIEKVNPGAVIISANTMGGYLHPHEEAVSRILAHLTKKANPDWGYHDVSYGSIGKKIILSDENGTFKTYLKLDRSIKRRNAYVAATDMSIYNTTNSGDIKAEQKIDENNNTSTFFISCEHKSLPTLAACMIRGMGVYLNLIKEIDLSDSGITDEQAEQIGVLPKRLTLLNASKNKLTIKGVRHLLGVIKLSDCVCTPKLAFNIDKQEIPLTFVQFRVGLNATLKDLRKYFVIKILPKPKAYTKTHIVLLTKV